MLKAGIKLLQRNSQLIEKIFVKNPQKYKATKWLLSSGDDVSAFLKASDGSIFAKKTAQRLRNTQEVLGKKAWQESELQLILHNVEGTAQKVQKGLFNRNFNTMRKIADKSPQAYDNALWMFNNGSKIDRLFANNRIEYIKTFENRFFNTFDLLGTKYWDPSDLQKILNNLNQTAGSIRRVA